MVIQNLHLLIGDDMIEESVTSGVHPNNTYPLVDGELDFEQEKRKQARDSTTATINRTEQPPFTRKGPDATRAEALAAEG